MVEYVSKSNNKLVMIYFVDINNFNKIFLNKKKIILFCCLIYFKFIIYKK